MLLRSRVEVEVDNGGSLTFSVPNCPVDEVDVILGDASALEPQTTLRPCNSPNAANFSNPCSRPKTRPSMRPARAPAFEPAV
jgi:hypothetical protein